MRAAVPFLFVATLPCSAVAQTAPRYAAAVRTELAAIGFAPQCSDLSPTASRCTFDASAGTHALHLVAQYDDATDTVYVYVDRFGTLRPDDPRAPSAMVRMMTLEWQMLVGKLEWSPATGEIRLSAVVSTDSNFDRRAFRGVVRTLVRLAGAHADEVAAFATNPAAPAH